MKSGNRFIIAAALSAVTTAGAYATDDAATLLKKKTVTSQNYVDTALATKQPILQGKEGNYAVVYPVTGTDEAGEVGERAIINYIGDADYEGELVTAGAVKTALDSKQAVIQGSNALNGKVITYTGTVGQVGTKDVYNSSNAYSGQGSALVEAQHVNAAVSAGFNGILTCADAPTCSLWQIDTSMSGTYVPQNQQ